MRRILLIAVVSMLASPVPAGTYKWVDDEGRTHYSDEPRDGESGGEEADLPDISTVERDGPPVARNPGDEESSPGEDASRVLRVVRPRDDQVFWEGEPIRFAAAANPGLESGHRVRFLLDGEPVHEEPLRTLSVERESVAPGTHALRVQIVDGAGKTVTESRPVTFEVRQPD